MVRRPSSITSFKRYAAVKVPGAAGALAAGCCGAAPRASGRLLGLPRKEVIQPHLPVRLPCYDFTPLTLHTFDASAPRGFGRRLRVQTTRVV